MFLFPRLLVPFPRSFVLFLRSFILFSRSPVPQPRPFVPFSGSFILRPGKSFGLVRGYLKKTAVVFTATAV